ncbi:MAG: hypothetical protein JJT81_11670 [Rubellimicrobium sp.]|nr:hypothetical protein [Rubellimicrobium sp.]
MRHPALALSVALALAGSVLADTSLADTPLSAEAFERLVTGRTMTFGLEGEEPYGIERYLPGRRVTWAFIGEACIEGHWFAEGANICFAYEDGTGPECWQFFKDGDGLIAHFTGDGTTEDEQGLRYSVRDAAIGLVCPGAGV